MKTVMMTMLVALVVIVPTMAYAQEGGECCQSKAETLTAAEQPTCCFKEEGTSECCASKEIAAPDAEPAGRGGHGKGRGPGVEMRNAHTLVFNYKSFTRKVEEIEGGVRTTTTTTDPNMLATLRKHPKEMADRMKAGGHVRPWDPLFAELGKYADEVDMKLRDVKNGIEVTSTSENPEVVKLIRAHAAKVNEFVSRGAAAMREKTPLPEDYKGAE